MLFNKVFSLAILSSFFVSCRPTPIEVDVPQATPSITISSVAFDEHTVFVSAGYSINSFVNLNDTSYNSDKTAMNIPAEMLVNGGLVTITAQGALPDTLTEVSKGLYASRKLNLIEGTEYTLTVIDIDKKASATAKTVFNAKPKIDNTKRDWILQESDTLTKFYLHLKNVSKDDRFFVAYCTTEQVKDNFGTAVDKLPTIYNFSPKTLELFTGEEAQNSIIDKAITMNIRPSDTLVVQVARIDNAYYQYLSAYKRSGYLINQLTGEPINLPTNIITGYGFFNLCQSEKVVFVGKDIVKLPI